MELENRLKEVLEEKNMTQKELSIRTGLTEGTISRYVNHKRKISFKNVYIIARCLGIELIELIDLGKR